MGKKKDKESQIKIEFLNNGSSVTGSCTIIKFLDRTILFEFGGIQEGHTTLADYKLNREQVSKVKAKDVDMIIGGHIGTQGNRIKGNCFLHTEKSNILLVK